MIQGSIMARNEALRFMIIDPDGVVVQDCGQITNRNFYYVPTSTGKYGIVIENINLMAVGTRGYSVTYSVLLATYQQGTGSCPLPTKHPEEDGQTVLFVFAAIITTLIVIAIIAFIIRIALSSDSNAKPTPQPTPQPPPIPPTEDTDYEPMYPKYNWPPNPSKPKCPKCGEVGVRQDGPAGFVAFTCYHPPGPADWLDEIMY